MPYGQTFEVSPTVQVEFIDAGHILGSAMVLLTIQQGGRTYRINLHRRRGPARFAVFERGLPDPRRRPAHLRKHLWRSAARSGGNDGRADERRGSAHRARGGKVLIPAFSLGRTQIVLHYVQQWMREGLLPQLPIYVDSPLAHDVSEVYRQHAPSFQPPGMDDLPVRYLLKQDESQEVTTQPDPCIIIASGGMCEGGRIIHHLRHHIDDPRTAIVLVSYQAPHSLGHRLLEKTPMVFFHGRKWNKWVEVVEINGFSGHADQNDFLALLGPAANNTPQVRLVHGEVVQAEALAKQLRQHGFNDVVIPEREEMVSIP